MQNSAYSKGISLVVCASLSWGAMAVAVQYLLQHQSSHPGELSALRLLVSGLLLVGIGSCLRVKNLFAPFHDRKLGMQVVLSGVIMFIAHLTFFFSIFYSNAGTGAIFLATQPLLASIYVSLTKRQYPSRKILLCMLLAFLGVLLIVTDGNLSTLKFSPACLSWGTASAIFATAYSIQPKNAVSKAGAIPVLAWGLIVGGSLGSIIYTPINLIASFSVPIALSFGFIVLVGTIFAFGCYLSSLKYISPVLVGLVVTLEPLSAFVFSILLLHETLGFFQAIGIGCIVTTVFLVSLNGINLSTLNRIYRQRIAKKDGRK